MTECLAWCHIHPVFDTKSPIHLMLETPQAMILSHILNQSQWWIVYTLENQSPYFELEGMGYVFEKKELSTVTSVAYRSVYLCLQLSQGRREQLPHEYTPHQDLPCMCSEHSILPLISHISSNRPKVYRCTVENGAPAYKYKEIVNGCYILISNNATHPSSNDALLPDAVCAHVLDPSASELVICFQ